MPSFINLRVIAALVLREMITRYGRSAGGYIWALLEPLGMIFLLVAVFSLVIRNPALGDSFALFYATGFLPFAFYAELSQFASTAVVMNKPLLNYPRVTPIDAILARCILQFITLAVASILIFSGIIIYEDIYTIYDFGSIILAVALAASLGMGVGLLNAVIIAYIPTYENVWRIVNRPMFLISGVFFTFDSVPRAIQDFLWFNPVIHVVGLMRKGFYPTYHGDYISILYVGGMAALFCSLGLFLIYSNRTFLIENR